MIDDSDYAAVFGMKIGKGENLPQHHFVHHKSHMLKSCLASGQSLNYLINFQTFYESECSLHYSQQLFTCPCLNPYRSCPYYSILRSILILSSHICRDLPSDLFPFGFPNKSYMHSPLPHATSPSYLILLGLSTLIMLEEVYKLRSSLCSFTQPPGQT
jgi:hypothetical protein